MKLRLALILLTCGQVAHAAPNIQPGLWEIAIKMDMPGMPAGMGQQVIKQCIRPGDIADPHKTLPKDDNCDVKDYKIQGNTASWRMECRGQGQMSGTGTITYAGNSYNGNLKMTMIEGGKTMAMTQTFAAKRVGDCK